METVNSVRQSILVNNRTVSIDLKDAYLHVPIRYHLKWCMDTNRFVLGTSMHPPDTFLFTDASHYEWGAHLEPMRLSFHGRWSEDQS